MASAADRKKQRRKTMSLPPDRTSGPTNE
uniref:Uncharacterized protein n=1 Tax=Arundo donax TaxID=35708 RepID=A0A0A9C4I0_ARUDO